MGCERTRAPALLLQIPVPDYRIPYCCLSTIRYDLLQIGFYVPRYFEVGLFRRSLHAANDDHPRWLANVQQPPRVERCLQPW